MVSTANDEKAFWKSSFETPFDVKNASIFAGVNGYLDKIDVSQVTRFLDNFLDDLRAKGQDILATIRKEEAISDDTKKKLIAFLDNFAKVFA